MRLADKLSEIDGYCDELESIVPADFTAYAADIKSKAACERYFEKIVTAIVDAAFLAIKNEHLTLPEDEKQSFDILSRADVISAALATGLKEAKGMRNILAHEYGVVDDRLVFHAITDEILRDAHEFVAALRKLG